MRTSASSAERFPIRTVAALTGVKPITLRAWERRYGVIRPARTRTGHRLYSHGDIEQIRRVLALLDRGIQISRVRQALESEQADTKGTPSSSWSGYLERMASAVSRFDEAELDTIYDEVLAVHSIEQVTGELLLPSLARLGERWKEQAGAIAEEHFLAAYLRSKLGARLQRPSRYARGPRLLAACAPLEYHEIGLLLFALEARSAGFRIVLLGADNPLPELAAAHRQARSDALVISSSVGSVPWLYAGELAELVKLAKVPVFVGGATAVFHRRAVVQAGAIPLGTETRDAVAMIVSHLGSAAAAERWTRKIHLSGGS
ncbi:MAG: MerR family transcriptional regulator [Sinobacteraceae bacterium]|nr:MerR family transcriptional regulator [Nevskiaceae bacterium]